MPCRFSSFLALFATAWLYGCALGPSVQEMGRSATEDVAHDDAPLQEAIAYDPAVYALVNTIAE